MYSDGPLTRNLVLIGGGHSHALVLLEWAGNPVPGTRLTLVNESATAPYTGMLPGYIAGHYQRHELQIDIVRLGGSVGAKVVVAKAVGLDCQQKQVRLKGRPSLPYDILSINIGVNSKLDMIPGYREHASPAKPLAGFAARWDAFLENLAALSTDPGVVVLGGGVAGVELALAMSYRLREAGVPKPRVTICEREQQLLSEVSGLCRSLLMRKLNQYEIIRLCGRSVTEINRSHVVFEGGNRLRADFVVGATGARPHDWPQMSSLRTEDGFICVDRYLRSSNTPDVFAVGDCCHFTERPLQKSGVFAIRQAPVLSHNLRSSLARSRLRPYRPQGDFLKIVSTGARTAVASKFGVAMSGHAMWNWKDRIDRRFMNKFSFPATANQVFRPAPKPTGDKGEIEGQKLCGGCGAKISQKSLDAALEPLRTGGDKGFSNLVDDAACVEISSQQIFAATDHLRAFFDDEWVMTRIAAVHALNDLRAMGAIPHSALVSLTIPYMSENLQRGVVREIMSAARDALEEQDVEIIGGHTTQGAELTIGFSVLGTPGGRTVAIAGARPGDKLLLTKPIGSGTILAAHMVSLASGEEVVDALSVMSRSSHRAAEILARKANALTDVSGFGLVGHLLNMLEKSSAGAELEWDAIPVMNGANRLFGLGVRSSLWQHNARAISRIHSAGCTEPGLLFDPQTSGGFLAAIPSESVDETLHCLNRAGEKVFVIGRIVAGSSVISVR